LQNLTVIFIASFFLFHPITDGKMRLFGNGLRRMKNSGDRRRAGTPSKHPRSDDLQDAIASGVNAELDRRGISGGGGGDDGIEARLKALETDVAIIKSAVVTKDVFEERAGKIEKEISRVPFDTIKWLVATIIALASLVLIAVRLLSMG